MDTKQVYIVRHGETYYNLKRIIQGSGINSDLNANGKKQAHLFYDQYKEVPFDKVYVSTLKRSYQSVQQFVENGIPSQKLSGLNEMNWGIFEGKPGNDATWTEVKQVTSRWNEGDYSAKATNGETPFDVIERLKKAWDVILSAREEKTILICTHGRTLRIMLCWLLDIPLSKMDDFEQHNLGLYVLDYNYNTRAFSLIERAKVDHLQ